MRFSQTYIQKYIFLNGRYHHPPPIFISTVYGEAIRIRRLNENKDYYHKSLNRLEENILIQTSMKTWFLMLFRSLNFGKPDLVLIKPHAKSVTIPLFGIKVYRFS